MTMMTTTTIAMTVTVTIIAMTAMKAAETTTIDDEDGVACTCRPTAVARKPCNQRGEIALSEVPTRQRTFIERSEAN